MSDAAVVWKEKVEREENANAHEKEEALAALTINHRNIFSDIAVRPRITLF